MGKRKVFRLPMMIFYENRGHFLSKKISMKILLHLHIANQNIIQLLKIKITPAIIGMNSWLKTENTLQSIVKSKNLQHMNYKRNLSLESLKPPWVCEFKSEFFPTGYISANRISIISFLKSLFLKVGSIKNQLNKILKPVFLDVNTSFYRRFIHSMTLETSIVNPQKLNYDSHMQIINSQLLKFGTNFVESVNTAVYPTTIEKESKLKYQSLVEHKPPLIPSRGNSLFNNAIFSGNRLCFENSNRAIINKPLIKNYYRNLGKDKSIFSQRRNAYTIGGKGLHFNDQRHIEQEIENVKKIVIETKASVLDKSKPVFGEADIKRYLDINRISSEVYQNIERRIRMERERRGA